MQRYSECAVLRGFFLDQRRLARYWGLGATSVRAQGVAYSPKGAGQCPFCASDRGRLARTPTLIRAIDEIAPTCVLHVALSSRCPPSTAPCSKMRRFATECIAPGGLVASPQRPRPRATGRHRRPPYRSVPLRPQPPRSGGFMASASTPIFADHRGSLRSIGVRQFKCGIAGRALAAVTMPSH
jgi:hypothetical protein